MLDRWFFIYSGVKEFMDEVKRNAKRYRKITDMWGRMEYIPQVISVFPHIREEGLRIAINQQLQSGAQGIIKEAMRNIWKEGLREWVKEGIAFPIIQIHDDLVFEIREDKADSIIKEIKRVMEGCVRLSIPVSVDPKTGYRWGEMKKLGKGVF